MGECSWRRRDPRKGGRMLTLALGMSVATLVANMLDFTMMGWTLMMMQ